MDDLISRKALLEFAHNHIGGRIDCNDIARFPAVDAELVRHGEWNVIETNRFWGIIAIECPECGAVFERTLSEYGLNSNYCQNCGAKMDGGKKD